MVTLLEKIQNAVLAEQSKLIDQDLKTCPNCGQKLSRNGYMHSKFHAVFSDNELQIQKHRCPNLECRWQKVPTVTSMFGTNIHPDLAKLQCEQGALFSYREAQSNLDKLNAYHRSVNSHTNQSFNRPSGCDSLRTTSGSPNRVSLRSTGKRAAPTSGWRTYSEPSSS